MPHQLPYCIVLAALLLPTAAYSQEPEPQPLVVKATGPKTIEAKYHMKRASRHIKLGEYEQAVAEYKKGVIVEEAPAFYFNLAQAYREIKNHEKAIHFYTLYLDVEQSPHPPTIEVVNRIVNQLKDELAHGSHTRDPRIGVTGVVSNSQSDAKLQSRSEGRGQDVANDHNDTGTSHVAEQGTRLPIYKDNLAVVTLGIGLAGLGVGIGYYVKSSSLLDDANNAIDQDDAVMLADESDDALRRGTIFVAAASALVVIGVSKWALFPRRQPHEHRTARSLVVTPTSIAIAGNF